MTSPEFHDQQNIKRWNIFLLVLFMCIGMGMFIYLDRHGGVPRSVSVWDIIILSLVTFRLTRLISYDSIMLFAREWFMRKEMTTDAAGAVSIAFVEESRGIKRAISILLSCLWCTGVWVALFSVFLYVAFPATRIIFIILAVASIAGLFQIIVNLIGWYAEYKKMLVKKERG